MTAGQRSKSGVWVADDFRDNLIVDRYDPVFVEMRKSKHGQMRSENSEDVLTWNVFRTLQKINPECWFPALADRGIRCDVRPAVCGILQLWAPLMPPPSLLKIGAESSSEIDILLETPDWVWVIEAKYKSDISSRTTYHASRDQVLRNIDVGSHYAGSRALYFSLLIHSEDRSPVGVATVLRYQDFEQVRAALEAHRPDRLTNLRSVSHLSWSDMVAVLEMARVQTRKEDEAEFAARALEWLNSKGIRNSSTPTRISIPQPLPPADEHACALADSLLQSHLSPKLKRFVDQSIESGKCGLQDKLRAELAEADASMGRGEGIELKTDEDIQEFFRQFYTDQHTGEFK